MKAQPQASLFDATPKPPLLFSGITPESRAASKQAAVTNAASGQQQTQCQRLLTLYRRAGQTGVSDAEVANRLGLRRHVAPARRRDLMHQGYVLTPTGERREGSAVWRMTAT